MHTVVAAGTFTHTALNPPNEKDEEKKAQEKEKQLKSLVEQEDALRQKEHDVRKLKIAKQKIVTSFTEDVSFVLTLADQFVQSSFLATPCSTKDFEERIEKSCKRLAPNHQAALRWILPDLQSKCIHLILDASASDADKRIGRAVTKDILSNHLDNVVSTILQVCPQAFHDVTTYLL